MTIQSLISFSVPFLDMNRFQREKVSKEALEEQPWLPPGPFPNAKDISLSETPNPRDARLNAFGSPRPHSPVLPIFIEDVFLSWHLMKRFSTGILTLPIILFKCLLPRCSFWVIIIVMIGTCGYCNRKSGSIKESETDSMQREPR